MTEAREKELPTQSDHEDKPKKDFESLRNAYNQTCQRHRAIDDFRGKVLALLPIASGAAGLLLLSKSDSVLTYLPVIGIYGCAVTAGLFVYELRGVHECGDVMRQAGKLEEELEVPFDLGQFRDEGPRPLHGLVGAEMASWIVYFSVFGGWLYLALWGLARNKEWHIPLTPIVIAGVFALIAGLTALLWKAQVLLNDEKDRRARLIEREKIAKQEAERKVELKREAERKEKAANAPLNGFDSARRKRGGWLTALFALEPRGRRPASRSMAR
jgi:hypothetical protein